MNKKKTTVSTVIAIILAIAGLLIGRFGTSSSNENTKASTEPVPTTSYTLDLSSIPEFTDEPYVVIDNNKPDFSQSDLVTKSYESYGRLDSLGRCTACVSCVGKDLMPSGERESISSVKPTGW